MKQIGRIKHFDLTVENADEVSKFYTEVVGWKLMPLSMGDYDDFVLADPSNDEPLGGICHSKGVNSNLPPQWLIYVSVENLETSLQKCTEMGGKVIGDIRKYGGNVQYCLIQDPAGAYMMLFEEKA